MRIVVINPFGGGEASARDNFDVIKRPDTECDIVNVTDDYPLKNNQWFYFKCACTDPALEKILWGERQSSDAIFLPCQRDTGLYGARILVGIPVTGTLESAALICYTMGKHFSLLSVDYQNGEIQHTLLKTYGLDGNLNSVISIGIDANDLYPGKTSEDTVIEHVLAATWRVGEDDGAEMIIPGCTLSGSMLIGKRGNMDASLGILAVGAMVANFKCSEMRAELNCAGVLPAVSRSGYFTNPPAVPWEILRTFNQRPSEPSARYGDP
jgi:Asp/Glu/hydantoin racemase